MFDRIKDAIYRILKSRLSVVVIAFCVLFAILVQRLFYLQIVKGQSYQEDYKLQIQKTKEIQGTRGNIYDRNGKLLAYNELAYSVTIEDNGSYDGEEKNEILNETINQVIDIVESHGDSIINDFGIVINANDEYEFVAAEGTSRLRFLADVYGYATIDKLSEKQRNNSAQDVIDYLCEDKNYGYGINQDDMEKQRVLKMVNIRYAMWLNSYQKFIATTMASDVSDETVADIMEHLDSLPGVDVSEESLRNYPDSKYFASILGYTGKISQEEYDALSKEEQKKYSLTDIVGKSGLEQTLDSYLQGTKGEIKLYVDSVGRVTDTTSVTESKAGNDVFLSIDKDLQIAAYNIIEEKLAGLLLSKIQNVMNYDPSVVSDAKEIIIPISDVYNAFFANEILDIDHLSAEDAKETEKEVYAHLSSRMESVIEEVTAELQNPSAGAYKDLSRELQAYLDYITSDVLTSATGILVSDAIDMSDSTYQSWSEDESISLYTYLNYAISKNWIDTSKVQNYTTSEGKYSDSNEIYQGLITFLQNYLITDRGFEKLVYEYLIKSGTISGNQVCMILYEQEILAPDTEQYEGLKAGTVDAYNFIRGKIQTLEITPGQLALEPCSGSLVATDPNTGKIITCVSYPGYDNNRLANTMDSAYYTKLATDLATPFYNRATQERTAPGSTYKMLTSVAGLTEHAIEVESGIVCTGEFTNITPSPKCWIHPGAHGSLNVIGALRESCNDFYYEVGYRLGQTNKTVIDPDTLEETTETIYSSDLGVEKIEKYATMFGLNEKTGLEIPESSPQISDTDSIRSAIGQGTNNYTTSQLARYVATVANGGTVYNLTLLDHVQDVEGTIIKEYEPSVHSKIDRVSQSTWDAVQSGMIAMVNSSPTFNVLLSEGLNMAGKTGTAQQSQTHPDHALFVGYAPAENPEVALSVRIANGYNSSYSAEIGRDYVRYMSDSTDASNLITGSAAQLGVASSGD